MHPSVPSTAVLVCLRLEWLLRLFLCRYVSEAVVNQLILVGSMRVQKGLGSA